MVATAGEARMWARRVLRGIGDSLYTPFCGTDDDDIDWDAYRAFVRYCVRDLGHPLLWCSSGLGEFWSLTLDERKRLLEVAVNLLRPVPSLRELSAAVRDLPVAYAVVGPSFWGDGQYPPSDAVYYPLYAKCAELGLPLCVNTGIPGPPMPGEAQHPMHLDRVCLRFPELRLCMIHGADPWWNVAIRLLIKYANLRLMTSAWSPKRLPESLLHYMRTRGRDKVIFASDWPVLRLRRVVPEACALDLPAEVCDTYLYNNADEFFFGALGERQH